VKGPTADTTENPFGKGNITLDGKTVASFGKNEIMMKAPTGFRQLTPEEQHRWNRQSMMAAILEARLAEHQANAAAAAAQAELAQLKIAQAVNELGRTRAKIKEFDQELGVQDPNRDIIADVAAGIVFIKIQPPAPEPPAAEEPPKEATA